MLRRRLNGVRNRTCGLEGKTTAMQSPPVCRRNYKAGKLEKGKGPEGCGGPSGRDLQTTVRTMGFILGVRGCH